MVEKTNGPRNQLGIFEKQNRSKPRNLGKEPIDLANRFNRSITLYGDNNEKHSIHATEGCYDPLSYPLFFPRGELGWHPNIPKHNVPWELAQQPRGNHDNDSGSPVWYAYMPKKTLCILPIWYLTFFFHIFPQRGTAGCVSLSGTTTVTGYRHALRYSTPYFTEHAFSSSGVSTCSSRLRVVG